MTEAPSAWPDQDWTRPAGPRSWWAPGAVATILTAPFLALSLLLTLAGVAARMAFPGEFAEDLPPDVIIDEPGLSDWIHWLAESLAPVLISIALTSAAWLLGRRHLGLAWCLAFLAVAAGAFPFWPIEWGGPADYGD